MSNFLEDLKKLPEWFKEENGTLEIMGKKKYILVLDKNESGEKELLYSIHIGDNVKDKSDALLYIYFDDPVGAQFRDYGEKSKIDFEDAKTIVNDICKRFNLPLKYIPINFHRQNRKDDASIEVEEREIIQLDGR